MWETCTNITNGQVARKTCRTRCLATMCEERPYGVQKTYRCTLRGAMQGYGTDECGSARQTLFEALQTAAGFCTRLPAERDDRGQAEMIRKREREKRERGNVTKEGKQRSRACCCDEDRVFSRAREPLRTRSPRRGTCLGRLGSPTQTWSYSGGGAPQKQVDVMQQL